MRRIGLVGVAMAASAVLSMGHATSVATEKPAAVLQDQSKRQRKRQAPKQQEARLAYPKLNRSRKWRPQKSYTEAAKATAALGVRDEPLRR